MQTIWVKLIASFAALALLIIHLIWSEARIDNISIYLLVIGVFPWMASIFETFEVPGGWKVTFRKIQEKQEHQQSEIATLKFLISHFLTEDELLHLTKLAHHKPFTFQYSPSFEIELRHLRALGFINSFPGKTIQALQDVRSGDLKGHFEITERGREYLNLRSQSEITTLSPGDQLRNA